jgi:predicted transcriptional regulator
MGVYHFMGVGRGVGAVTCAVDYIEKSLDLLKQQHEYSKNKKINRPNCNEEIIDLFAGAGGITDGENELEKGKIQTIVLFTSKEVIKSTRENDSEFAGTRDTRLKAYPYKGCDEPGYVRDEIIKQLKKIWKHSSNKGREVYWCAVDIDDFEDCLDKITKVAQYCSAKQGHEIWCNLTGGSNSIGQALVSMAWLTGKSAKNYMLSQAKDYQKEITVPQGITIRPNQDRYFKIMPFLRTQFAMQDYYNILDQLKSDSSLTNKELLIKLQNLTSFSNLTEQEFVRKYLISLYSQGYTKLMNKNGEIEGVSISKSGEKFLEDYLENKNLESRLLNVDIGDEAKKWDWFEKENLGISQKRGLV